MELIFTEHKQTAKRAGLLYLFAGLISAFGLMYSPSKICLKEDSLLPAQKILENEFLFRLGILSEVTGAILFVMLAFVLYRLFKDVDEQKAKLLFVFVVIQLPVTFALESFRITAIMILKGSLLSSIEPDLAKSLAMVFLKTREFGMGILEIFWGLWLIPFGQLVIKSKFIPRILGVFLIIGGVAYIFHSFTYILFPAYKEEVANCVVIFWALAEIPIMFWLLIKGTRDEKTNIKEVGT